METHISIWACPLEVLLHGNYSDARLSYTVYQTIKGYCPKFPLQYVISMLFPMATSVMCLCLSSCSSPCFCPDRIISLLPDWVQLVCVRSGFICLYTSLSFLFLIVRLLVTPRPGFHCTSWFRPLPGSPYKRKSITSLEFQISKDPVAPAEAHRKPQVIPDLSTCGLFHAGAIPAALFKAFAT